MSQEVLNINTPTSISQYWRLTEELGRCSETEKTQIARYLCRTDIYWLLWWGCGRKDVEHPWLLERCKEVNASPDEHLDLWARDHYKSTIITFGLTLQEILASHGEEALIGHELTFGLFSHTRPIAKKFLRQIQFEMENNALLKALFPDVLYDNPQREAPAWSLDAGIVVRRKSNPKEATVEAWGLVDGQPIASHFERLVYDDVVTRDSVNTPDMMQKTTEAIALSYNLGTKRSSKRFIGTRYHFNDSYKTLMERGTVKPRIYPATDTGDVDGHPVLSSRESLEQKRRDMGEYVFACQMLQNPKGDKLQGFKREWLRWADSDGLGMNKYILVDPANEKKRSSDNTAMWVVGLGTDGNYYALDLVYDRLSLQERTTQVFELHRKWGPLAVGYEKYGKDSDIEHIEYVQAQENYRFDIIPLGGRLNKQDRIRRLMPIMEQGRFYFRPEKFLTNWEGRTVEVINQFLSEEYDAFPVGIHDDALDALSRICDEDMQIAWPKPQEQMGRYDAKRKRRSWRAA